MTPTGVTPPGSKSKCSTFGGDAKNHDLPHNYIKNCVAYTGTHDNDTTVGWWNSQAGAGSTRDEAAITHLDDSAGPRSHRAARSSRGNNCSTFRTLGAPSWR